jgi:hypothetical protein
VIPRNAEPIEHRQVYKPINLHLVRRPPEAADPVDLLGEALRRTKAERIWKITKQTAEGCNAPSVEPAPQPEVCTDGWDAA